MDEVVNEVLKKKNAVDDLKNNLHKEIEKMKNQASEYPNKLLKKLE